MVFPKGQGKKGWQHSPAREEHPQLHTEEREEGWTGRKRERKTQGVDERRDSAKKQASIMSRPPPPRLMDSGDRGGTRHYRKQETERKA